MTENETTTETAEQLAEQYNATPAEILDALVEDNIVYPDRDIAPLFQEGDDA